jgi:hypothetical protein
MARRPQKPREKNSQPPPGLRPVSSPAEQRVLPMELQVGDRLTDETGEWEIIGHPYTTNAGKVAHVGLQRVGEPAVTEIRTWGAHERITVKREEGKR